MCVYIYIYVCVFIYLFISILAWKALPVDWYCECFTVATANISVAMYILVVFNRCEHSKVQLPNTIIQLTNTEVKIRNYNCKSTFANTKVQLPNSTV